MEPKNAFQTNIKTKTYIPNNTYSMPKPKFRAKTAVKEQSSAAKRIKNDQTYQNVLNRLLRLNNLKSFYQQSSKYVIFKDAYIDNFNISKEGVRRSLRLVASLGNHLLKDGGFIKHYCGLLQAFYYEKKQQVRDTIFQAYQKNIEIRGSMFEKYFARERNIMIQKEQEQKAQKKNKKSSERKKIPTIKLAKVPQTILQHQDNKTVTEGLAQNQTSLNQIEIGQINNSNAQNVFNMFNFNPTEDKHSSVKKIENPQTQRKSQKKKNSKKTPYDYIEGQNSLDRQARIQEHQRQQNNKSKKKVPEKIQRISLKEELKVNPILKKCYQQILQIQEIRKSIMKSKTKKNQTEQNKLTEARKRFSISHIKFRPQFRELNEVQQSNLSEQERELLRKWPNINLIAAEQDVYVLKQYPAKVLGSYGQYKLIKGAVVSKNEEFRQWGLIMQPLTAGQRDEYKINEFDLDEQIKLFVQKLGPESNLLRN